MFAFCFLITLFSLSPSLIFVILSLVFPAGRRSRRNSFSEDSQLTIENFGGSQDQLNMIGQPVDRRFQDRERKISNASNVAIEPTLPVRSSLADARGSIQIGYESDGEKEDRETEKPQLKRQNSNTSSSNSSGVQLRLEEKRKMSSFASLTPSTTTWQQQSLVTNQINETRKYIKLKLDFLIISSHFRRCQSTARRRHETQRSSTQTRGKATTHREGKEEN